MVFGKKVICPFQGKEKCMKKDCGIWNEVKEECSIKTMGQSYSWQ